MDMDCNGFFLYFSASERLGPEGASFHPSLASMWRPLGPRYMGLPYGATERSMYSLYGSLLGMSGSSLSGLALQGLNPLVSGALSPASFANGHALLASSQESASGALYHSALYGQRYHPYLPHSGSSSLKRPSGDTSPLSLP